MKALNGDMALSLMLILLLMAASCVSPQPVEAPAVGEAAEVGTQAQVEDAATIASTPDAITQETTGDGEAIDTGEPSQESSNELVSDGAQQEHGVVEAEESADTKDEVADLQARTFAIVPERSQASYFAQEEFFGRAINTHAPFTTALARTSVISGTLILYADAKNTLQDVAGEISVDLRALTSDDARRDRRVRQDFLQSNTYPLARFEPTGVELFPPGYEEGRPATFKLLGNLTIREITQPVVFEVTAFLQEGLLQGKATSVIRMTDFGVNPPNLLNFVVVQNPLELTIDLVAEER